tara:strand:- start:1840 stop:2289 length:450 start_codon:yes stop_codon:yes gene_type:complete
MSATGSDESSGSVSKRDRQEESFEYAIEEIDGAYQRHFLKSRRDELYVASMVRTSQEEKAPYNSPSDTFAAAISAVSRATNIEAPALTVQSDPELVFKWIADSILTFGAEMAEEGRSLERERIGIPLNSRDARLAFELMNTLNELLTNR